MFSIYGVSGQVFSGTLEEMNRVNALARARAVRAIAEDGEELGIEAILGANTRLREDAVKAYCREHLAIYKVPRSLAFRHEALPRNATGKVDRGKFLKELKEQQA